MNINAFVLNLPKSKDRWDSFILNEAPRSAINFERIDGVSGSIYCAPGDNNLKGGIIGCVIANRNLIEIAKLRKYDKVLILEDDAQLCQGFDQKLQTALTDLPENWCILRLHQSTDGQPRLVSYTNSLNTVTKCNGTYGWVVNNRYYDIIIQLLTKNLGVLQTDRWGTYEKTFDSILMELQETTPFFQTKENLVFHADGHSDRLGITLNYGLGRKK